MLNKSETDIEFGGSDPSKTIIQTPLHKTVLRAPRSDGITSHFECIELLLKAGAKCDKQDTFGCTPLMYAALQVSCNFIFNTKINCIKNLIGYYREITKLSSCCSKTMRTAIFRTTGKCCQFMLQH
jgi:hypothetical protein